jgi:hypothetical protein
MKHLIIMGIAAITFTACNQKNETKDSESTAAQESTGSGTQTSTVVTGETPIKPILAAYLKLKNAFAQDNDKDAAAAGDEMVLAFTNFDKSKLTAEQSKIYADIEDDAREHAEHIGKNAGNIKHQREHFEMLSKDMYQLVKTFGAGQTLYYDNCPMYNDGKGGNWLSEAKEISNPYMGKKMATCGSVKEELK